MAKASIKPYLKIQEEKGVYPNSLPTTSKGHSLSNSEEVIKTIVSYLEDQFFKLKAYEGTPIAESAKKELDYYASITSKDTETFEKLKTVNPSVAKSLRQHAGLQTKTKW